MPPDMVLLEIARGGIEQDVDTEGMGEDSIYDACIKAAKEALKRRGHEGDCADDAARYAAQCWAQP